MSRGEGLDRLEDEKLDFLVKARNGYLTQAKEQPERFEVIDASQSKAAVLSDVIKVIDALILKHS
jgi:dTMP kinase